mgnify:CR=1 FL=1
MVTGLCRRKRCGAGNPDVGTKPVHLETDVTFYSLDLLLILFVVTLLFTALPIILMRSL